MIVGVAASLAAAVAAWLSSGGAATAATSARSACFECDFYCIFGCVFGCSVSNVLLTSIGRQARPLLPGQLAAVLGSHAVRACLAAGPLRG